MCSHPEGNAYVSARLVENLQVSRHQLCWQPVLAGIVQLLSSSCLGLYAFSTRIGPRGERIWGDHAVVDEIAESQVVSTDGQRGKVGIAGVRPLVYLAVHTNEGVSWANLSPSRERTLTTI